MVLMQAEISPSIQESKYIPAINDGSPIVESIESRLAVSIETLRKSTTAQSNASRSEPGSTIRQ